MAVNPFADLADCDSEDEDDEESLRVRIRVGLGVTLMSRLGPGLWRGLRLFRSRDRIRGGIGVPLARVRDTVKIKGRVNSNSIAISNVPLNL